MVSRLFIICGLLITAGCASTNNNNELTSDERLRIQKLFIVSDVGEVGVHTPTLKVVQNSYGTQVSVLGSGNQQMSRATYNQRSEAAVKAAKDCLSDTYDAKEYADEQFGGY